LEEGFVVYSIRAKFIRGEEVKFISHLDLMKSFERAIRRSRLPIAYSQGFNPHPQMVFGLPLSVGVTSEAEYGDFELNEPITPRSFMESLNPQLPAGLTITDAEQKSTKTNIMATISAAAYDILVYTEGCTGIIEFAGSIDEMLHQTEVNVTKEGKQGNKKVNIRPMIHRLDAKAVSENELKAGEYDAFYRQGSLFCVSALLSAGSTANLKPELLVTAIGETLGMEIRIIKIHRTGLYVSMNGEMRSPLDSRVLSGI
jgi:radical SAM-linked protein